MVLAANRFLFIAPLFLLLSACADKRLNNYVDQYESYDQVAYVIDHGIHTAIVVDAQSLVSRLGLSETFFSQFQFIEIGRGDAGFYQAEEETISITLKALFLSTPAVLHLSAYSLPPGDKFPLSKTVEIRLSRQAMNKLLDAIASDFKLNSGRAIELAVGRDKHSRFFQSRGSYHLFYTCNNWTADVIEQADYPIRHRWSFFSSSVMKQLKEVEERLNLPPQPSGENEGGGN